MEHPDAQHRYEVTYRIKGSDQHYENFDNLTDAEKCYKSIQKTGGLCFVELHQHSLLRFDNRRNLRGARNDR